MDPNKPRLVGLNHVALEVGDVEDALRFCCSVFAFELRGTHKDGDGHTAMAFIDLGDQFLALIGGRKQAPDTNRHFGLVVDDRRTVMAAAQAAGATAADRQFNFIDPWGNHIEIVAYADVQFSKIEAVLRSMGLSLDKGDNAKEELRRKGIAKTSAAAEPSRREVFPIPVRSTRSRGLLDWLSGPKDGCASIARRNGAGRPSSPAFHIPRRQQARSTPSSAAQWS